MEKYNWTWIFPTFAILCGVFAVAGFISLWGFIKDPALIETSMSMLAYWLSLGGAFFSGVFTALTITVTGQK